MKRYIRYGISLIERPDGDLVKYEDAVAEVKLEREACAKLADEEFWGSKKNGAERGAGLRIGAAIRARGEK